jgi:hypothetical protein
MEQGQFFRPLIIKFHFWSFCSVFFFKAMKRVLKKEVFENT